MRAPSRTLARFGVVAATMLALACGDDSRAPRAKTTPMTVWVFDEGVSVSDADRPLGDVEVALDPPGGAGRIMLRTEADGHLTFDADFTRGSARVSALSPDHTLVSMLDVSPESVARRPNTFGKPASDLVIVLPKLDMATLRSSVELRGTLTGKQAPEHVVDVAASSLRRLGATATTESSYTLHAPKGRPFFLLGHELGRERKAGSVVTVDHFKAFRLDVPARDADAVLDVNLDAAPSHPTRVIHLGVVAPSNGDGATRARADIISADSTILAAPFTKATPGTDGRAYALEMTLVDVDVGLERLVTQATIVASDGSFTRRSEIGVVADGASWADFLAPPVIPEASRTIADPLPLPDFPPDADLRIEVFANQQLIWILRSPPPREKQVILPALLDLDFSADVQLFAVSIAAELDRVELPPHGELYRRVAVARDVIVRRR